MEKTDDHFLTEALQSLIPNGFYCKSNAEGDYEVSLPENSKDSIPSKAEVDSKITELKKEYSNSAYARKREAEYPSIQECVHAILDDDLTALQEKRQAVKTKYPKS